MQDTVIFRNEGALDLRAITIMGVSSKENSNPIGFFGTGLKYAIAICLREGQEISLYTGGVEYTFYTERTRIRVDEFDLCFMRSQFGKVVELPFTTDLGKNWKLWQAFRELYSNVKDEDGEAELGSKPGEVLADQVVIAVSGREFTQVYADRKDCFLEGEPLHRDVGNAEVHYGQCWFLYSRGIRAYDLPKPSKFTYNAISGTNPLTEDRTLTNIYGASLDICRAIATMDNVDHLEEILLSGDKFMEGDINYEGVVTASPQFIETVARLKSNPAVNRGAVNAYMRLTKTTASVATRPPTDFEQRIISKAVIFLASIMGCDIDKYKVLIGTDMPSNHLGRAFRGAIYLAPRAFDIGGAKYIAQTILEEFIHLEYNVNDETRAMQDVLLEIAIRTGEQMADEPL